PRVSASIHWSIGRDWSRPSSPKGEALGPMNTKWLSLRRASGSPIRVWVSISTRRFGDERSSPERSGLLTLSMQTRSSAEHQTTNLGVSGSNPFGRAIFRDIPCDSHGIHTATYLETGNKRGRFRTG